MKKIIASLALFLMLAPVFAQEMQDDIKIIQTLYGKQKRELVGQYLNLSPDLMAKFSPIYEAYENDRKEIGKQRIMNITEYANSYGTADDAKLDEMTKKALDINAKTNKLMSSYYGKVKKAIGAKNAAKFFQIESYLELSVKMSLWENIPLIDELDGKSK